MTEEMLASFICGILWGLFLGYLIYLKECR